MNRRMLRILTVSTPAFAAMALLASMTAPAAAAVPPIPNFDSSVMHGNEAEDAIAINPANPSNIVTMATLPDVVSGLFEGVSFNGGKTLTRQVIGTAAPLGEICCDEQLAWDRFGNLWMTYLDQTNGQGGSHIYTAVDANGLQQGGFSDPRLLAHSAVGGFDYIPAQPDRSVDAEANLAWDRSGGPHNGRVYVIWTQESPNESDNTDIMFQYSGDNGATWTAPARLNDDHTATSQFMPAIAVDQTTGDLAISWYDSRNDLGSGGPGDTDGIPNDDAQIWATYSTNGGVTFAPNFQVSAGTFSAPDAQSFFDYGDYTHAAFQSNLLYPAWSDNSNSTAENPDGTLHQLDLFTAKVAIP